jgi:hypothetical protein
MSMPITIAGSAMSASYVAHSQHREIYIHTPKYGTYKAIKFPVSALVKPCQLNASTMHVDVVKPVCTAYTSRCIGTDDESVSKP